MNPGPIPPKINSRVEIKVGLKFKSVYTSIKYEVSAVREDKNQVDLILTATDGNAWEEKNSDLEILKLGFQYNELQKIELKPGDSISVW